MALNGSPARAHGEDHYSLEVWGVPFVAVHCNHCREDHLVLEEPLPQRCPLCHHSPLELLPAPLSAGGPEQMVPFALGEAQAVAAIGNWSSGVRFRPEGFALEVLARSLRRYWIPLWLIDADVEGEWRAEAGYNYEVVSYQDRYAESGGWRSREVTEKRIRWEPRAGRIARHYDNVAAPGVEDDVGQLMDHLGGYDLESRAAYAPRELGRGAVRLPALSREAAWPLAEPAFTRAAEVDCRRAAGADQIRDFTLRARYQNRNWTHLLLPAYATWYEESCYIWPVLVNGQTGRIYGQRRASARKGNRASVIMGGVALALFAVGALLALIGVAVPPMVVVGSAILAIGLALGLAAPVPAIFVWVRNRGTAPVVPP